MFTKAEAKDVPKTRSYEIITWRKQHPDVFVPDKKACEGKQCKFLEIDTSTGVRRKVCAKADNKLPSSLNICPLDIEEEEKNRSTKHIKEPEFGSYKCKDCGRVFKHTKEAEREIVDGKIQCPVCKSINTRFKKEKEVKMGRPRETKEWGNVPELCIRIDPNDDVLYGTTHDRGIYRTGKKAYEGLTATIIQGHHKVNENNQICLENQNVWACPIKSFGDTTSIGLANEIVTVIIHGGKAKEVRQYTKKADYWSQKE